MALVVGERRVSGFVKEELKERLWRDCENLYIFREADMQSSTYHHLRNFFDRNRSGHWYLRSKHRLNSGKEPDLAIYYDKELRYLFEFKFFPDRINDETLERDWSKLKHFRRKHASLCRCYSVVIYDEPDSRSSIGYYQQKKLGMEGIDVVYINMRRRPKSKRTMHHYGSWKSQWKKLRFI